ncbi:MAG TPA: hypothetical protein VHC22_21825 [Pirellulales bacterium]|nr:hypothetical protein [Pirellulales bacterium]
MKPRPQIPEDVKWYIREIFAECNRRVSTKLSHIPNLHETSLDHSFIEHFTNYCRPIQTPSDWTVRFDCHFIGGGRHYMRWEVADFGILVVFRYKGEVWLSKVTLLQSKRLFAKEFDGIESNPLDVDLGFNFLFMNVERWRKMAESRDFRFDDASLYRSLEIGDTQYVNIEKYEQRHKLNVHYLLYNPLSVPHEKSFPIMEPEVDGENIVGCRVVPSKSLRAMVAELKIERPPSFGEISTKLREPFDKANAQCGWRLEDYIVDELLACKDGLIDESAQYDHLMHIFSQKSQPIHAALVITFDMATAPT